MAIFSCKMCGGNLTILPEMEVCECEFCGTKQTLPKLDNNRKESMYDRANHFRRNNDFDKAMSMYEQILNEDETDAEAYWSIVLCRYGIEYVEDPSTHERIPTVNRAQYTSIFADEDYKEALRFASVNQKEIFEREAKTIDDIQKGILEISKKEKPFDIFICYKETDESGKRTQDSVIANDLYYQLTREGFKVFFAAITLEDKLGKAYEPYIFAALNSAKVMIVLGTKPGYFNAPWVKNEWSRYLKIIKKDPAKLLIPAYRDMDPYDLPEEFSFLQAQDMSKIGFMNDIIHGIKKLLIQEDDEKHFAEHHNVVMNSLNSGSGVEPLIKRAFFFLEEGSWTNAMVYCEKVLDQNPECAEAYLCKLLAEKEIKQKDKLANSEELLESYEDFRLAFRFADLELKNDLEKYSNSVKNNYLTTWEEKAQEIQDEEELLKVIEMLKVISDFERTPEVINALNGKTELLHKEKLYKQALDSFDKAVSEIDYRKTGELFKELGEFRNAIEMIAQCNEQAEKCAEKDDNCSICKSSPGTKIFIPQNNTTLCCENCYSRLSLMQQNLGKTDTLTLNCYNHLKDALSYMTKQIAINRVKNILDKYESSVDAKEIKKGTDYVDEEEERRQRIFNQEMALKEQEEERKREEEKKQETIAKNAKYEYEVQIVVDNPSGGIDVDMLKYVIKKYSEEGWKLHTITVSGMADSMGQTVVIFERRIKEEQV